MDYNIFEKEYLQLFFKLQKQQWENYALDKEHDLSDLDKQVYLLFRQNSLASCTSHRARTLHTIARRSLVDKDTEVAGLRNRLDNPANYACGGNLTSPDLARAMRSDVLRLMDLRNTKAREQGFASYTKLVFACEELELAEVVSSLELFLGTNLTIANALINKYNIQWKTWFSDLRRLGRPVQADALIAAQELLAALDLEDALKNIKIVVKDQPISGVAMALNVPGDVRILLRPVKSLAQLCTLYHEAGHALAHVLNSQEGVYKTWTAIHDETMAITIERIGLELLEDEEMKSAARELALLEEVRCALSFLFELDVNACPDRAEELYRQHYGKLALDPGDGSLWSLDSFRTIDPAYIHNYVLGGIIADKTLVWLKKKFGRNPSVWGNWLKENWYASGRRRSLWAKTETIRLHME